MLSITVSMLATCRVTARLCGHGLVFMRPSFDNAEEVKGLRLQSNKNRGQISPWTHAVGALMETGIPLTESQIQRIHTTSPKPLKPPRQSHQRTTGPKPFPKTEASALLGRAKSRTTWASNTGYTPPPTSTSSSEECGSILCIPSGGSPEGTLGLFIRPTLRVEN